MGLTIHYTLTLPATTERTEVVRRLEQLRERAAVIPDVRVDKSVLALHGPKLKKAQAERFFLGCLYVPVALDAKGSPSAAADWKDTEFSASVDPDELAFFGLHVPGSETAFFGVARLPDTFEHRGVRLAVPQHRGRWFGDWHCKTQYASDPALGGNENFLRAHLSVVAVLDAARELGFGLEVDDEGTYWESRSVPALLTELDRNNRLVAGLAGMLKDRLGPGNLVGSILARADFERLEAGATADGMEAKFEEALAALLRLTKRRA